MKVQHFASLLTIFLDLSMGASTFSPARPPAIPLAVKSPYMNTYLYAGSDGGNGGYLAGQWPQFWASQVTGWAGLIRVDGTTYTWMGAPPGPALVTQTAFEYTSTRSTFIMSVAGVVSMNVSFISPITPNDLKRQSLVFMYLDVTVQSIDGNFHIVELYSDTSAEWVSGDLNAIAQWEYGVADNIAYHKSWRQTQILFSETRDQADWGYWYWATENVLNLTYQSGADVDVRSAFVNNGKLEETNDTNYRPIQQSWPVFGFAIELGPIGSSPVSTLFTLGLAQEIAIQFDGASGLVDVPSLWTSFFTIELDALSFFYNDYSTASAIAASFDSQVASDSIAAAGQEYLTITSLSARQAFGANQLCGNETNIYNFLKEISSDGDIQTVDVIFPFHPILLYTNPKLLKYSLDPLFENMESGKYPNKFSMHDLGSYPNATGHPLGNDEPQPLEECGNMLIMTLAYAKRANDVAYLAQHYKTLKQWTEYLVEEALYPQNQISTDDFAGPLANQTNLALKGMIGIEAMSVIASLTGNTADAANYTAIAHNYINQWQNLGVAHDATPPHTTLGYGLNDTHGLLYNLYADKELSLGLIPQSIYDMQSAFYPTVALKYGVPLDTRHIYTKSDWEIFVAAIASPSTQAMLIHDLATWINETPQNGAFSDLYMADTGDYPPCCRFAARPVVGGHFALLGLKGSGEALSDTLEHFQTSLKHAQTK